VARDACVKDTCVCYRTYIFSFEVWTLCILSRSKLFSSVEDSMSEDYGVHTKSMLLLWNLVLLVLFKLTVLDAVCMKEYSAFQLGIHF